MNLPLLTLEVRIEFDVVLARQRARQIAGLLGFAQLDQTRIATATSEIARNSVRYAGGGRLEFAIENGAEPEFMITFIERPSGFKDFQKLVDADYSSLTGRGLGSAGARRLMDRFAIDSSKGASAVIVMAKSLPHRKGPFSTQEITVISTELAKKSPQGLLEELQEQNQELLATLQQLRESQAELARMHSNELDETNRGVLALYAELDEGTKALRRMSDLKSRFLSEMSHELRSPLNSIKALTGFLLARSDGDLTSEQEKQVKFIRLAVDGLSTLVDDVLDIAKVEAGKAVVRASEFSLRSLFEVLDGTVRPMLARAEVNLIFEDPVGITTLETDEGKVGQILRNFLTNAVKFTDRGEIRVSAHAAPDDMVVFAVRDSGIGIAAADQERIFEDYGQIESPLQMRAKGFGLGLPLTRKLAGLLGGTVSVESEYGAGSTFSVTLPRKYAHDTEPEGEHDVAEAGEPVATEAGEPATLPPAAEHPARHDKRHRKALIVDDAERDRYLIKGILSTFDDFEITEADRGEYAVSRARSTKPDVIFLDLVLPDATGFQILEWLKEDADTKDIPVIVNTSKVLDQSERDRLSAGSVAILAKGKKSREEVIADFREALVQAGVCPPMP